MWQQFGDRDVPTSYNISIHLNDYERTDERMHEEIAALDALLPGLRANAAGKTRRPVGRRSQDLGHARRKRDHDQSSRAVQLSYELDPSEFDLAKRAEPDKQLESLRLADAASHDKWLAGVIDRYRDVVNYNYWRLRAKWNKRPRARGPQGAVRRRSRFRATDLDGAKKLYDEGLAHWRVVLDAYPQLKKETIVVDELADSIIQYEKILSQLDLKLPEDFVLQDVLDEKNKSPNAAKPPAQTPGNDVTGPEAETGGKKPAPKPEGESPARTP